MAANKITTLLHRNTNTLVVTLVYAVLEWVLILLLLLNSLFSYVITKFAKWVGLKPPCLLCSRLDHVLESPESNKGKVLQSDVVCETHAAEISKMGFCSIHGKMAETQSMCEDCLLSIRGMAFVSWFSEKSERCSCCDKSLRTTFTKETLIVEASDDDDDHDDDEDEEEGGDRECDHQILFDVESFILREVAEDRSNSSVSKDAEKDHEKEEDDLLIITETDPIRESHNLLHRFSETVWEDRSFDCINLHFETNADDNDQRVIPVELIDSFTSANIESCKSEEGLGKKKDQKIETLAPESSIEEELSMASLKNHMVLEEDEELKNDGDNVESAMEKLEEDDEQDQSSSSSDDDAEVQNAFDEFIAQNNICQSHQSLFCEDNNKETTPEEEAGESQDNLPKSEEPSCCCECIEEEDQSLTSDDDAEVPDAFDEFISQNNLGAVETGANDNEDAVPSLVEENHEEPSHNNHSPKSSEEDEVEEEEEDKLPETPSSVDVLHYLNGKMLLYEKAEDSVDGTEIENGDSVSTIEQLKTDLKSERKALSALYHELEEERSASAIAANQTMAMITRLQEEKAAMHMEALQYQRMMEEQSEYDQEALQLLNDLMVKREKEKKELEKELEEYKQKVMDFEAKEKLRLLRRMKNGSDRNRESSSSSAASLGEDITEEQSFDLNCEPREEEEDNINTTTTSIDKVSSLEEITMDCVKHMNALDSSLAEFEEEKLSILYQLKALEEKLITLGDKEQLLDDLNQNCFFSSTPEEDMCCNNNVYSDDKQCQSPRMPMASLSKRLLPFLDAVNDDDDDEDETEESYSCGWQEENSGNLTDNITMAKVSMEEEVDHVYEKLQALEHDTEFLKNCMGSPEQGDQKGMDLLQDILHHLRDLKAVELRLNHLGDDDSLR